MRHTISLTENGPRGEVMADAVQSCVHCGFCLAACPTYKVLGEEMDSPRGRIYLMKNVLEGNLDAKEAEPYIDRCLGCMGCVPACPSGVQYGDLLTSYRAKQEEERKRPFIDDLSRRLIKETLPYPNRFRVAALAGKVGKLMEGLLPSKLEGMLDLVPDVLPRAKPLPAVYPAKGEKRATVALVAGCVQTVIAPNINWATLEVLAANGVETIIPQRQGCCGSIMMHIGEEQRALQLARQNLAAFPDDVDAILTNAAGCGSGMHEYGLLFKGQPEHEQALAFADKVMDVTVFLAQLGLRPLTQNQPQRIVAYQDACHLAHAQGVVDPPRQLLRAVPNLSIVELGDEGLCCGSAGTYNLEQPEIAHQLGEMKAQAIMDSGAAMIVTGNIGCLTQIKTHLALKERPLPIQHTIELLAEAFLAE